MTCHGRSSRTSEGWRSELSALMKRYRRGAGMPTTMQMKICITFRLQTSDSDARHLRSFALQILASAMCTDMIKATNFWIPA